MSLPIALAPLWLILTHSLPSASLLLPVCTHPALCAPWIYVASLPYLALPPALAPPAPLSAPSAPSRCSSLPTVDHSGAGGTAPVPGCGAESATSTRRSGWYCAGTAGGRGSVSGADVLVLAATGAVAAVGVAKVEVGEGSRERGAEGACEARGDGAGSGVAVGSSAGLSTRWVNEGGSEDRKRHSRAGKRRCRALARLARDGSTAAWASHAETTAL